jgi:hypothetical protein
MSPMSWAFARCVSHGKIRRAAQGEQLNVCQTDISVRGRRKRETVGMEVQMSVIYYVALPFVRTEEGAVAGQAQEMPNESAAIRRAEAMSREPANAGALAFKRSGDPNMGNFSDAVVLKAFGDVPENLDEL